MLLPDPEPRQVHHLLISVDDHLIEPPDVFEGRIPAKLADRAPKLIDYNGAPAWQLEDKILPNFGLNAVAGRPPEEWDDEPRHWDEMRKGCWQIDARIADMDLNGVYASICFPSRVAGFGGARFSEMNDKELGFACVQAWNDWHYESWHSPYPNRIIPLQVAWLADPVLGAKEIERNAARGFKVVTFLDAPPNLGYPPLWDDYWVPFFDACQETETVIACHIGASGLSTQGFGKSDTIGKARIGALQTAATLTQGINAAVGYLYGGVCTRFPRLKIALAESGAGWVPALLDRLEYMTKHAGHAFSKAWTDPDLTPAETLLRNFWFCAFDDYAAIEMRHRIGVENILLEVDYPHGDGTWPDSQEHIAKLLEGVPADEAARLSYRNAAELFRHPLPPGVV